MNILPIINILLNTKCDLDPRSSYQNGEYLYNGQSFDFIVVGAGSAGSVVASRLSENKNYNVLLLEAGGYPDVDTEVPTFSSNNLRSKNDWDYELEKGNYALFQNEKSRLPRGKVLGGSSSINGMFYVHSLPSDYDTWASMGNPGWDYKSVLKYFKKAENLIGDNNENFGTGGPITITAFPANDRISEAIKQSLHETNIPILNREGGNGLFQIYKNIQNGTRCSTAKAYLANLKRPNLRVITKAHVMKVLLYSDKNKAVGVKVSIDGRIIKIYVSKEIILSAGAINSPQILLLSGIGPERDLKELGISVKVDLPIGRNLQDHYFVRGFFIKLKPLNGAKTCLAEAALEYCFKREGPWTKLGSLGWSLNTKNQSEPDMLLFFAHSPKGQPEAVAKLLAIFTVTNITLEELYEINANHDVLLVPMAITNPKSRGVVKLSSTNPFDPPLIYPNYISDEQEDDLQRYVNSVDYIKKMVNSAPMRKLEAELVVPDYPNCRMFLAGSQDFYKCVIRNMEGAGGHMTTTCKMGPEHDPTTVVDHTLRVHGVKGLRVVDASVMPVVSNRNTNAPTIMIAEKASEMILKDWNNLIENEAYY